MAGPLLAVPAFYAVFGPQRVTGPTQPVTLPGIDLLGAVLPADHYLLAGRILGWKGPAIPLEGDMAYLGIPMVIVLIAVVAGLHRVLAVRVVAVTGLVSWVVALGPRLVVDGRVTQIPLPFALFTRVPVLQDVTPSRLTLYVDLAAAVLMAFGVAYVAEHAGAAMRSGGAGGQRRRDAVVASLGIAGLAATLAPLVPTARYPTATLGPAAQFAGGRVARAIPAGAIVLSYPYPAYPLDQAMLWQAEDGMRFSLLGGYALRPDRDPALNKTPPPLTPAAVPELLSAAAGGAVSPGLVDAAHRQLVTFVLRYRVTTVVVQTTPPSKATATVIGLFSSVYGDPRRIGAFAVWNAAEPGG